MNSTTHLTLSAMALCLATAFASSANAGPAGGVVTAGSAGITATGAKTTITQQSQNAIINWRSFGIAAGESVQFAQPNASSVTLNRVLGSDASAIMGNLSANGRVFLVNPNGILFGSGASVNVGGLVASTLNISDTNFMAGRYSFSGTSEADVVNRGTIDADNGFVALVGAKVVNERVISARLGTVVLAAGSAATLDIAGDNLLNVTVDQAALNAVVHNGGLIQADGGRVLLTATAAGSLLSSVVNNTGVIQAQTISNRSGSIKLLAGMREGSVDVQGALDASAPHGGNGGFIETSAARVTVGEAARVTTLAALGTTGQWLIDPQDFTIGGGATDNISGATLSALLVTNSVTITTATGPDAIVAGTPPVTNLHTATVGNGDINVNQAVSWTAAPSSTTLTLNATRDVNINKAVTAVNGNVDICCGRDVNVGAAITTTNGSVLLSAGRNVSLTSAAAMTTTDGNIMICAANDINIGAALTLTRGSSIPAQSLGLPQGLVLSAGTAGTGPGVGGGEVIFAPLVPRAAVTGPNAPVTINYNPVAYTAPTNYSGNFTLTGGSTLTQHMLVFAAGGTKTVDGTTATTLSGLKGGPVGVTLVASAASTATFDSADVGTAKSISFSGYTLAGPNAADFTLPVTCCGPIVAKTTGDVLPAVAVVPVVIVPTPVVVVPLPVVVPPPVAVLTPPVVTPHATTPEQVVPQFTSFLVALPQPRTSPQLLVVSQPNAQPLSLVVSQAEVAPAPAASAPVAAEAQQPVTAVPPSRPAKPYRN